MHAIASCLELEPQMRSRILHGICKLFWVVGCGFLSVVLVANAVAVAIAVAVAVVIDGGAAGEAQQPQLMLLECVLYLCVAERQLSVWR